MTVNANVGLGTVELGNGTDTTLVLFSGFTDVTRYAIAALDAYNSGASAATISLYFSDDETSAAGTIVQQVTVEAGDGYTLPTLIGQGSTQNLIATCDQADVNVTRTVTTFG